jgi:hypothetical protein
MGDRISCRRVYIDKIDDLLDALRISWRDEVADRALIASEAGVCRSGCRRERDETGD